MKKFTLLLAVVALVSFTAGSAVAQCDFNAVKSAKKMKFDMVRAFAECTSTQHPATNTTSASGLPVCSPVKVKDAGGQTPYIFDTKKGGCKGDVKVKVEKDCSKLTDDNDVPLGLAASPCSVLSVKLKCKGITTADGTPVGSEAGSWKLRTLTRSALADSSAGDTQIFDFPLTFDVGTASDGKLKLDTNSAIALVGSLGPSGAALSTCAAFETIKIEVADGNGRPFARMGTGVRDKSWGAWPF